MHSPLTSTHVVFFLSLTAITVDRYFGLVRNNIANK